MSTTTPRHAFYETDERVTLSIFEKNVDGDKATIKFEPNRFTYEHGETKLVLDPLRAAIDPTKSDFSIGKVKVEVRFTKLIAGRWGTLTHEGADDAPVAAPTGLPAAPASRSKQHKNWEGISKAELEKEKDKTLTEDANAGGDAALNGFFQQIYGSADEDTRRAMMKSFVESGGTALSTNWDEVRRETVPVRPPEGSEWKKWN
ncbi:SGS-domain-containing protein [Auriculariales sp. MPI-PUGE-AT-0066]|nr:SGS-domain-containing protein [Auriculariales sp. MPI-PUGE-AT-0066]